MNRTLSAAAIAAGLLLGACAGTPEAPPELVEARAAVRSAEIDPAVLANAPLELKKATDSLNRANVLLAKRESLAEISSAAHVASQQARTALAIARAKGSDDAIRAAEAERERARADVKTVEAQRAQAQASSAQAQASAAREQAAVAEQRASSAERQAAQSQASAGEAQMQATLLQRQLNDLQARQTERGLLVTLGDVLFEFNRDEVKPSAQAALRKLADFLQQYPTRQVLIEGHTDNIGSAPYNEMLSLRRAESVAAALALMGVSAQRVSIVGYGKDFPVADNSTDTNRALNRRVEVYISDSERPVRPRG